MNFNLGKPAHRGKKPTLKGKTGTSHWSSCIYLEGKIEDAFIFYGKDITETRFKEYMEEIKNGKEV